MNLKSRNSNIAAFFVKTKENVNICTDYGQFIIILTINVFNPDLFSVLLLHKNQKLNFCTMEKIDQLDRKILRIITQNARMPFKDVAEECGVSRAAIHQRVQRLIDMDVITGSGYTVNPKMLGFQMCVYIGITLERGSMYKEVVEELEKIPEIVESQYTLGHYTILIKLYARNDEHLMELLNGKIQEIPGVASTETLTSLDQRIRRSIPIE